MGNTTAIIENPIIELDDVYKSFGELHVLRGVSIRIKRGETLCIIGQSGTGKSVSLRLILGLLSPNRGRVLFENNDIAAFDEEQITKMRERFAMLFQGGALFDSMTVGENVSFGLRAQGEEDPERLHAVAEEKLRQVGLPGIQEKLPSQLSGGQKKRVALARAIAVQPEVILYDEPTTGLDPIMSDAIADLIIETRESLREKNVTSIVVTHDMHVAMKTADRIVMLHGGRIVGEGEPAYFAELQTRAACENCDEQEAMIRQFVRGEAEGPIQTTR